MGLLVLHRELLLLPLVREEGPWLLLQTLRLGLVLLSLVAAVREGVLPVLALLEVMVMGLKEWL
jgi:hypothetical protein